MSSGEVCPNCAIEQPTGSKYCDRCGAPVQGEVASKPFKKMSKDQVENVLHWREEKDQAFKGHFASPIPENMRGQFAGLKYYPVNPSYRFLCRLNKYPNPASVMMMTSTGEEREYLKVGHFSFIIGGKTRTLHAYKDLRQEPSEKESLFIPFRDSTSGIETYEASRYLETEETKEGEFLVDFNKAYNPFCAYTDTYSCPLPPRENWVEVEIKAGEKKYKD